MIELWEIVLQYKKICLSIKDIFGLRMESAYFIVYLEKKMFPQLCFFFYIFLSQHFLLPSPLISLTFQMLCLFFPLMSTSWRGLMAEDMKGR